MSAEHQGVDDALMLGRSALDLALLEYPGNEAKAIDHATVALAMAVGLLIARRSKLSGKDALDGVALAHADACSKATVASIALGLQPKAPL